MLRDDAALAARLGGAADALFESVGIMRLQADDQAIRDRLRAAVENELGDNRTSAEWNEGRASSTHVVERALAD